jgi:hypothetical protein
MKEIGKAMEGVAQSGANLNQNDIQLAAGGGARTQSNDIQVT